MKSRPHRPHRALAVLAALASMATTACGAISTSPPWVGGGLEVGAPAREAEAEAAAERERVRIASQPARIGAKHILVMHVKSKSKPETITRTREEARARAKECLLKIRNGLSFDEAVKQYSDEPGAAERGGDLGVFDHAQMVKPFSDAAFALKVGEVSELIETQFGFHIVKRTE